MAATAVGTLFDASVEALLAAAAPARDEAAPEGVDLTASALHALQRFV